MGLIKIFEGLNDKNDKDHRKNVQNDFKENTPDQL